jgi:hypothetical protein
VARLEKVSERIKWILRNVETTRSGRPMRALTLSVEAGLAKSRVGLMIARSPLDMNSRTAEGLSYASRISKNWIQTGRGSPHDPDVPEAPPPAKPKAPRYRVFGDYPEYEANLKLAIADGLIDPPEASVAGAELAVTDRHRPAKLDPHTVAAACLLGYYASSENRQGAYSDRYHGRRRVALDLEGKRAKTLTPRESGFPERLTK